MTAFSLAAICLLLGVYSTALLIDLRRLGGKSLLSVEALTTAGAVSQREVLTRDARIRSLEGEREHRLRLEHFRRNCSGPPSEGSEISMERDLESAERAVSGALRPRFTIAAAISGEKALFALTAVPGEYARIREEALCWSQGLDLREGVNLIEAEELPARFDSCGITSALIFKSRTGQEGDAFFILTLFSGVPPLLAHQSLYEIGMGFAKSVSSLTALQKVRAAASEATLASERRAELLAHFSHDLRSPLSNIKALLELLKCEGGASERDAILVGAIRNAERLGALAEDVLDYSKHQAGRLSPKFETLDANLMLLDLFGEYRPVAAQKGIELAAEPSADAAWCAADPSQLRRALANIFSNAVKFTEVGRVSASVQVEGETVIFRIEDTGRGISDSAKSGLFCAFERGDYHDISGAGLGLVISKSLLEANGATLEIESKLGQGTSAVIKVKRGQRGAEIHPLPAAITTPANPRVLLVDDDYDFLFSSARILKNMGVEADCARNIAEASAALESSPAPDAVISDLRLGGESGAQLFDLVRRRTAMAKFFILTGAEGEALEAAAGLPVTVLQKPVDFKELCRTLISAKNRAPQDFPS